ncbi:hypothetical protein, partial [Microcoleus sp. S36b_A4]|uniref:hypothetical protein n=1 Tax=Microcoleus sp. S36b_A4 TaxID=3055420 RepID=UPI002FD210E2
LGSRVSFFSFLPPLILYLIVKQSAVFLAINYTTTCRSMPNRRQSRSLPIFTPDAEPLKSPYCGTS